MVITNIWRSWLFHEKLATKDKATHVKAINGEAIKGKGGETIKGEANRVCKKSNVVKASEACCNVEKGKIKIKIS
jgi:hypothetical protein